MKCQKCNKDIPDGSKFCNHCGQQVEENKSGMKNCSNTQCCKEIPSDSRFCPFCGTEQQVSEVLSNNNTETISNTTLCNDNLFDLSEYDFLNMSDISDILSDDEFLHKIDRGNLSEGSNGEKTVTLQYKHLNILAVIDDNNSLSKFVYKNISIKDLCTLFGISEEKVIANSEDLQSFLVGIEKTDGDDFVYSNGYLRFYLRFRNDGSIRYMIVEKYKNKSFLLSVFPLNGVVLGETYIRKFGKKHKFIYEGSEIRCKIDSIVYSSSSNNKIDMVTIDNSKDMPEKLKEYGFDWYMSYDEYKNLFRHKGLNRHLYFDTPKVISKKGRYMLYATISLSLDDVVWCELIFDMGNKNGEGTLTSSHNSLYQIILSYVG